MMRAASPHRKTRSLKSTLSSLAAGMSGNVRGLVWMVGSTVLATAMLAVVRHVSAGIHPFEIAFFRQVFGLVVLSPWLLLYGFAPLRTRRLRLHGLRAAVNLVAMLAYFTAVAVIPLAEVTALAFAAPIFATILAMVFLGEVVRLRRWAAILFGFAGVMVVLRPGVDLMQAGSMLVLLSAAAWACALIVIKMLGRTESSLTITIYMSMLMAPFSLIPALFVWQWPSLEQLGWLAATGALGTGAQLMLVQALKEAETQVVMPADFLKLIWAAVLGYLLFEQAPNSYIWLGGAMIFVSTTYIAWREHQLRKSEFPTAEPPFPHIPGT
jgi:drug/metabolite transporter (DMT)-like permease